VLPFPKQTVKQLRKLLGYPSRPAHIFLEFKPETTSITHSTQNNFFFFLRRWHQCLIALGQQPLATQMFSYHASSSSSGHYRLAVKTSWFRTLLPKIAHQTGLKGLWIHDCPAHKATLCSRLIRVTWNLIRTRSLPSRCCLEGRGPRMSRFF